MTATVASRPYGPPGRRGLVLGALACALLAGCAALPPEAPPATRRADPTEWSGRFSAVYTQPGASAEEQNASGRFRLVQREGQTLLELSTPIGQTIAQAQVDAKSARLTDHQGRHYQAPSAEALTEQLFGWRVPVLRLPDWLQGRFSATGIPTEGTRPAAGSEAGWDIQIVGWLDDRIVRTLQLSWPTQGTSSDRRLKLRLIVDSAT